MSSQQSANFDFLKAEFSLLHNLCLQAEYYLYTDPDAALAKLRLYGEKVSDELCQIHFRNAYDHDKQHNRIRQLSDNRILPPTIVNLFNNIRLKGNDAIHKGQSTRGKATSALSSAFSLAKWMVDTYGDKVPAVSYTHLTLPTKRIV